jgi:hypothetical protein
MLGWWDPSLLQMLVPSLRQSLTGALDDVRREFQLWKWRRYYARHVKTPPDDAFHPTTMMAPVISSWPEPAARRDVLQLSLF